MSSRVSGIFVLTAAIIGSGMGFLDATAVNVILPILQRDLHGDAQAVQWVVEGYALFLSSLILVGGALGDVYGRRKMFIAGAVVFAAASAACAAAQTMPQLIAARCIQGIGAALLVPGSLALISAHFEPAERGKAFGSWAAFSAISGAIGPVMGGFLAQHASWRWVFLLNVPLAAAVIVISFLHVRESRNEHASRHIDFTGATLVTLGLGAIVYALIDMQGALRGMVPLIILGAGIVLLAAFLAYEKRAKAPMMPLELFRSREFSGANAYTFLLYAGLGGSLFFVPFDLINVQHYTPTQTGLALVPITVIIFAFSRFSGSVQSKFGEHAMLTAGALVAALGFMLFATTGQGRSYWLSFFPASVVLGAGAAIFVAPLTSGVMNSVETAHAGLASGVNNAIARAAGLIAVAALGLVLGVVFYRSFDSAMGRAPLAPQTRVALARDRGRLLTGYVPPKIAAADRPRVRRAIDGAFVAGFFWEMTVSALLALLAAGIAKFSFSGAKRGGTREEQVAHSS